MKWNYKVISTEKLYSDSFNHDIAVSKHAAEQRRENIGNNIEAVLNKLGEDGWDLVSTTGEFCIFKKGV